MGPVFGLSDPANLETIGACVLDALDPSEFSDQEPVEIGPELVVTERKAIGGTAGLGARTKGAAMRSDPEVPDRLRSGERCTAIGAFGGLGLTPAAGS